MSVASRTSRVVVGVGVALVACGAPLRAQEEQPAPAVQAEDQPGPAAQPPAPAVSAEEEFAPPGSEAAGAPAPGPKASWNQAENELSLDMSWFAQSDSGGNPAQREGVRYLGGRTFVKVKVLDELTLRGSVIVAHLEDGGTDNSLDELRVFGASVTEPSQDQTPVTATLHADVEPGGTTLKVTPGLYSFTQSDYQSNGASLDLSWELNGGDTVPFAGFEARFDEIELNYWDQTKRGDDERKTFSFLLGVTQVLSPKLVTSFSAQYVHQQGFMGDPVNRILIYQNGNPDRLVDERLPRRRDRLQLNGRARYSLGLGWSLGLDASGYVDSWSISNGAFEPNFELTFLDGIGVVRAWYRLVVQDEARYFDSKRETEERYQTGDSDLGEFVSHGAGLLLSLKLPMRYAVPELHGTVFVYRRDDDVEGLQISAGTTVRF